MRSPDTFISASKPLTILLVDDYDALRLLLSDYLTKKGFRVLEAGDGVEAVKAARSECGNLCLILMDLNLPELDGLGATLRIREIAELCDVPIIACTARSSEETREAALAAGCTDLVAKPIDKTTMEAILSKHLPSEADEV
jgi:CheY-like chemotaxis protein